MDFPSDVVRFVEHTFALKQTAKVYSLLRREHLTTPRVARSVLYLSKGQLSLLEHFIHKALVDVNEVLLQAECETDILHKPVRLRDMALPFTDEQNLGPNFFNLRATNQPIQVSKRLTNRNWRMAHETK